MNNNIIKKENGEFEVQNDNEIQQVYKENILRLNPLMEKCFPELMPLLKVGDTWVENFGRGRKMIVKGFDYRKCPPNKIICYVLQTLDGHKSIYTYPCWALDKWLKADKSPESPLDFEKADTTANRYITEEPIVIFPDKNCTNLAKCFVELKRRYNKAVDLLLLQSKIIEPAKSNEPEVSKLENDIVKFIGEDFDLRVDNKLNIKDKK